MNEILDEEIGNSDQIKKVNRVFSSLLFGLMTIHMIGEIIGISIPTPPRLIIGIELGFLVVLKGRSIKNKRRLIAAPFLLFFLSEWDLGGRMFSSDLKWILVASVILLTGLITYFAVKQKLKRLDV